MIYKIDTPAKRRDCLCLLLGLPVSVELQRELARCGLATGVPTHSGSGRVKGQRVELTRKGRVLALSAMAQAPHGALTEQAQSAMWIHLNQVNAPGVTS